MNSYAIFIGIDQYTDRMIRQLHHANRDAQELYGLFRHRLEFGNNAHLLPANAQLHEINNCLDKVGSQVRAGDLFVFYFAGHGFEDKDGKDQYLLLPSVKLKEVNKNNLIGQELLSLSNLKDNITDWPDIQKLFILDNCRSTINAISTRGVNARGQTTFHGGGINQLFPRRPNFRGSNNTAILNSCQPGESAYEPDEQGEGGLMRLALELDFQWACAKGETWVINCDTPKRLMKHIKDINAGNCPQEPWLFPENAFITLTQPRQRVETPVEVSPSPTKPINIHKHSEPRKTNFNIVKSLSIFVLAILILIGSAFFITKYLNRQSVYDIILAKSNTSTMISVSNFTSKYTIGSEIQWQITAKSKGFLTIIFYGNETNPKTNKPIYSTYHDGNFLIEANAPILMPEVIEISKANAPPREVKVLMIFTEKEGDWQWFKGENPQVPESFFDKIGKINASEFTYKIVQ